MGQNIRQAPWKERLRPLLDGDTDQKIIKLQKIVDSCRSTRRRWVWVTCGAFLVLIILVSWLWLRSVLAVEAVADVANGAVALLLALWTFLQPRFPSLDHTSIDDIAGKAVRGDIYRELERDAHGPVDLDRAIPFVGATALAVVLALKTATG